MSRLVKIAIALAVVIAGLAAADVVLRNRAETALAQLVARQAPGSTGISTRISSFPFIPQLLTSGHLPRVDVEVARTGSTVAGRSVVPLTGLDVVARDVELDTSQGLQGPPRVKSIGRGEVRASITAEDLRTQLPASLSVRLVQGVLQIAGALIGAAQLTVSAAGDLLVRLPGVSALEVPLPVGSILPCPPKVTLDAGTLNVQCAFESVPQFLVDAVNRGR